MIAGTAAAGPQLLEGRPAALEVQATNIVALFWSQHGNVTPNATSWAMGVAVRLSQ